MFQLLASLKCLALRQASALVINFLQLSVICFVGFWNLRRFSLRYERGENCHWFDPRISDKGQWVRSLVDDINCFTSFFSKKAVCDVNPVLNPFSFLARSDIKF